jgi:general secretion pathway protein G
MQLVGAKSRQGRSRGFTLVELAIVVLVIGILAAVAAPKMVGTAATAKTNGTKQSLAVIRDAIEMYKSQNNNAIPTAANLPTALQAHLSGPFPIVQVGANQNALVAVSTASPITTVVTAGNCGWVYNETTGEIRVKDSGSIGW